MSPSQNTLAAPVVLDDEGLLRESASGSREAFEQLYHRFAARAYRVAWLVCRDDGRAEDAVQEAFIAISRRAGDYRRELGTVSGWVLSMVRYRAIDLARANAKHARTGPETEATIRHPARGVLADQVIDRDSAAKLKALLQRLPDAQREVIMLAFYGELSHAEIAARLHLPPGTIKGRIRLGLQKLRVNIDQADMSERLRTGLASALRDGDLDHARRVMREAIKEIPPVTMLDDVLAPAMHNIGTMWETAEITVADEHLATTICHRLVAEISMTLHTAKPNSRETVLLVTPEPERHELGLLMASAVLDGAGYNTLLLGSGVPGEALSSALRRHQPALVAVSSSMPGPASLAAVANLVHDTLPAAQLITGGATARQLPPDIAARYVGRLDDLLDAVDAILAPGRV